MKYPDILWCSEHIIQDGPILAAADVDGVVKIYHECGYTVEADEIDDLKDLLILRTWRGGAYYYRDWRTGTCNREHWRTYYYARANDDGLFDVQEIDQRRIK